MKIDGELIGHTPVQRDAVSSGDHIVEFKLKGFFDHKETMKIEGGREKVFSVDLKALPSGPTPEQVQRRKQGMSSFGAKVNPVGGVTADFGLGYPYYVTVRLMVGAVAKPGIEVGVEFQTFFNIANLALMRQAAAGRGGAVLARGAQRPGRRHRRRTAATPTSSIAGAVASLAFSDVATVNGSMRYSALVGQVLPDRRRRASNGVDAGHVLHGPGDQGTMPVRDEDPNNERASAASASTSASASPPPSIVSRRSSSRSRACRSPISSPTSRASPSWTRTTARSSPRTTTSSTAWPASP